jgi:hypothetical protein
MVVRDNKDPVCDNDIMQNCRTHLKVLFCTVANLTPACATCS